MATSKCSRVPIEEPDSSSDGEYAEVDDDEGHHGESCGLPIEGDQESFLVLFLQSTGLTEDELKKEPPSVMIEHLISELLPSKNISPSPRNQFILKINRSKIHLICLKDGETSIIDVVAIKHWGMRGNHFALITQATEFPLNLPVEDIKTKYLCHVFLCEDDGLESSSQKICNRLREERLKVCLSSEMKSSDTFPEGLFAPSTANSGEEFPSNASTPDIEFLPTPLEEEPTKVIKARYLGCVPVQAPSGIDVLNDAIDRIVFEIIRIKDRIDAGLPERDEDEDDDHRSLIARKFYDINCRVKISPSSIIVDTLSGQENIFNGRVRYLSFMGISRSNVKTCGIIMQVADSVFEAHAFDCEPNAGDLCKSLEAACRLRYQKCLDAHRRRIASQNGATVSSGKVSLEAVKTMFSKILFKTN